MRGMYYFAKCATAALVGGGGDGHFAKRQKYSAAVICIAVLV